MTFAYALTLGLIAIWEVNVGIQKINGLALAMHKIEALLVADTHMKVIIKMSFFILSNINMAFVEEIYLKDLHRRRQGFINYQTGTDY